MNCLNPKFIKAKGDDKQGIIMIKVIIRIDTYQIVQTGECHSEVELSMDIIIQEGQNMLIIIEMALGEEILEECKTIEVRILQVDREETIDMAILEEVDIGLGKDNIQVIFLQNDRSSSSRSTSGLRTSTNRDRIRCFKCKEYDHFIKDC